MARQIVRDEFEWTYKGRGLVPDISESQVCFKFYVMYVYMLA